MLAEKLLYFQCMLTFSQATLFHCVDTLCIGVGLGFVRNMVCVQADVSQDKLEKEAHDFSVFFSSLPHYVYFLLHNLHSTAPTKTISPLGNPQSITLPQRGTIRLILARVAPNLAASQQWV